MAVQTPLLPACPQCEAGGAERLRSTNSLSWGGEQPALGFCLRAYLPHGTWEAALALGAARRQQGALSPGGGLQANSPSCANKSAIELLGREQAPAQPWEPPGLSAFQGDCC